MALIDIIAWDGGTSQVAWKFPSSNLRLGSQLVVKPGQTAFFVYRGKVCDEVTEGTTTLKTGNIPLLTTLLSLPFGGDTPFQAEVWFINKLAKLDTKWGTPSPIQVEDPKYGIIVPMRAFGQYGFRVSDARIFLTTLLGASAGITDDQIKQYFRGKVMSTVGTQIGTLFNEKISFLNISAHLDDLSESARLRIAPVMEKYGILLETFFFESLNVPEDDPSYLKLKQIKEKAAELNVVGRDIYQLDKSMDVLKTAAGNQGVSGLMMQSGIGAGMGVMMGAQLGQQAGQMMTQMPPAGSAAPPPLASAPSVTFYVALNGQQAGPFPYVVLQQMQAAGSLAPSTSVWRQGMAGWQSAGTVPELVGVFTPATPPPLSGPPPLPTV
ncbi:MAG: SPFH domain-containing protein [Opitutaceae bacterium]|nr:SPFH domain-containing protein [Opitutaceae bacterium]MBP9911899.1 SPFH domain-containing protein [Opitutaceae bacterium]